jgi:hypothetical protein
LWVAVGYIDESQYKMREPETVKGTVVVKNVFVRDAFVTCKTIIPDPIKPIATIDASKIKNIVRICEAVTASIGVFS